jgi:hypothetical protein
MVISYLLRQLQCQGDILGLTALVAAAEQDDQERPALHVIDPVSGAIMATTILAIYIGRRTATTYKRS